MNLLSVRPSRFRLTAAVYSLTLGTLFSVSSVAVAQAPVPPPAPVPTPSPAPGPQTPRRGPGQRGQGQTGPGTPVAVPPQAQKTVIKPYEEVVKDAKTEEGLFKVHRIDTRALYEIPTSALGKEMLWVTTLSKTQTGYGYGGTEVQNRVVRWEKRDDKILLRGVGYETRTQENGGLKRSIERSSVEPILQVFDVLAYNKDKAPVIDVTSLFTTEVPEFSARKVLSAGPIDARRSFLEKVRSFPRNIEVEVTQTYTGGTPSSFLDRGPQRVDSTAVTVVLRHSMVLLPDKPMMGRLADSRVGFFQTGFFQFGGAENRVEQIAFANRWRLEKKDPSAAISEPVKPITYYISPEVPEKWHPYIKKGVEDWQLAFEKAGFKNAIVCKEVPTAAEDPEFDEDDVRYSVIRWLPSTTENAYGPSIVDPRSGEILNANPKFFHNVLKLVESWYFVQASPNDKSAQKLPLPESKIGVLLRYVVSHEIGHTLGLLHNMKASSTVSIAQLRSPKWTSLWGTESSIMDYGRMNYVTQPGDGVTRLIPKQGPYDYFAIQWGYGTVPGASTPEAEKPALDKIASRQIKEPMLRFGNANPLEDPHRQTEDLGSDPVRATELGLKNIDRVLSYIVPATEKPGEDYTRLQEIYDTLLGQRLTELNHVVGMVGGVAETDYHYQRGGSAVYESVPAADQKRAVQFLLDNAFATPTSLLTPDILSRLEASGVTNRVLSNQAILLSRLLVDMRLVRMIDQEVLSKGKGKPIYTMAAMMEDVRHGIFSELGAPKVTIDPIRRNLQRSYIGQISSRLTSSSSDVRPIARKCLMDTQAAVKAALPRATDASTRAHLVDLNQILQQTLYPGRG
jgi:hypothetical protein